MSYTVRNAKRLAALEANAPRWQVDRATERGPCVAKEWQKRQALTLRALLALCEVNNRECDYCDTYGEPGYSDPTAGILFANWNDIPKALCDRLERQGYELEWSDEWYIDHQSGKAYRTSPDSYGWESSLMYSERSGEYLTPDDDVSDWVAECENNAHAALPSWVAQSDIEALGWELSPDIFESGLHPGQTDDPRAIAKTLKASGREFLFQIADRGQFDILFHVYTRTPEGNENE